MNKQRLQCYVLLLVLHLSAPHAAYAAPQVEVKALFSGRAVIMIDGQQKVLRAGESFAGLKLLEANSKRAVVEIAGERRTLQVGRRMGAAYTQPAQPSVRIASQMGGHYVVPGNINRRPVEFLVDTGATMVAFNSEVASSLGIDYAQGQRHLVQTASGTVTAYRVMLNSVAVGDVVLHSVEASVLEGSYPQYILLGNTFLSRVNMQVDDGVLVLQAKF